MSMEPDTTEVIMQQEFQTVEELQDLLTEAVRRAGRHPSELHITSKEPQTDLAYCRLTLEAEGLSDRSVVYNVTLE